MKPQSLSFADLFAGIGGFHAALHSSPILRGNCVFASEIDSACCDVYEHNFGFRPDGDIWPIARRNPGLVPDHDLLCAGFPCQPFSKSGHQRGISEARGTLFEAILLILQAKRPQFVLLENVRNLIGPRHRDTWATIVRLLGDLGYAVSSEPSLISPHELPPGIGSPQVRERVFIPAVYVGRRLASEALRYLPALISRPPFPEWDPSQWRVCDYLDRNLDGRSARWALKPEKATALEMWDDFIKRVPGRLPRFPIWTDVFLGALAAGDIHPGWKNAIIAKNAEFYAAHRTIIDAWMGDWAVADVIPSYRKLEWQAQDGERSVWSHAVQFRPSGVRVRPLTYLPALVAINQTSIIGPLRRTITPDEAGRLQGFSPEFLGGARFEPHPDAQTAFRQFGNAVHVGVTRFVAEALVLGTSGQGNYFVPPQWREVVASAASVDRHPSAIVADDVQKL